MPPHILNEKGKKSKESQNLNDNRQKSETPIYEASKGGKNGIFLLHHEGQEKDQKYL